MCYFRSFSTHWYIVPSGCKSRCNLTMSHLSLCWVPHTCWLKAFLLTMKCGMSHMLTVFSHMSNPDVWGGLCPMGQSFDKWAMGTVYTSKSVSSSSICTLPKTDYLRYIHISQASFPEDDQVRSNNHSHLSNKFDNTAFSVILFLSFICPQLVWPNKTVAQNSCLKFCFLVILE